MNSIIDSISKSLKITDYLSSKGFNYSSRDGNRYKYKCPLPSHPNDNSPSFFIFDKPNGQDYYCFGCKSSGNVVNFVSAFEQISLRETLEKLSKGLNISVDDIIDSIIRDLVVYSDSNSDNDKKESIIATSLFISNHMYDFLSKVNFNKEDLEIAEKLFKIVDSYVLVERLDDLEEISALLPSRTKARYDMYVEGNQ